MSSCYFVYCFTVSSTGEVQVLDFQTQQYRLFPQIASAYALHAAGEASSAAYRTVSSQVESGNLQDLPIVSSLFHGYH